MRLLEHDDARRLEVVRDAHDLAQLIGRDPAAIARQRMRDETGVHRRASGFEHEHVRPLLGDQLAAPLRLAEERDLVRHRRGREEERLLLAEEVCRPALELVDGRVLAELLVAHVGGRHRRAHLGSGIRGGVGAEIDHGAILAADGPEPARGDARRPRGAGVPRNPGLAVGGARRLRLRRDDERARHVAAGARRRRAVLDARSPDRGALARRHREDALLDARRPSRRGRAHDVPRRAALPLPLLAIRLPAHVHVLRHGTDAVPTESHGVRDPRPGAPLPPPRPALACRLHGHGRADAQPRPRHRRGVEAARSRRHAPPNDRLDRRLAAGPSALRGRASPSRSASRSRCTRPTTPSARSSCP